MNRNYITVFTKAVIKAVHGMPSPWKPNKKGGNGYNSKTVAVGCLLKIGFNQTYDGIEA